MVDITSALVNQILLERFRASSLYYNYAHQDATGQAWEATLLAYGVDAPERLLECGCYTAKEQKEHGVPRRSPIELLGRGVDLLDALDSSIPLVVLNRPLSKDSLLNLGCALVRYGNPIMQRRGRKLLERLRNPNTAILQAAVINLSPTNNHEGWVNSTTPEELEVEPYEFEDFRFNLKQLRWFTPETASRLIAEASDSFHSGLGFIKALSDYYEGRWDEDVQRLAESELRQERGRESSLRVRYKRLAQILRIVDRHFFIEYMGRCTGVRISLGVVREDAPDHIFNKGLRRMNTPSVIGKLGPWVGRPLQLQDIVRISPEALVDLMWTLPWEIVQNLAVEHTSQIRPKFLKLLDKPEYLERLRECLTNHPKRQHRAQVTADLGKPWENYMKPVIEQHMQMVRYRERVLNAGLTKDHLLLMALLKDRNLTEIAKSLPVWDTMEQLLPLMP